MRSMGTSSDDDPPAWRRTDPFKDQFELVAGDRVLATLTIGGSTILTAQIQADRWAFCLRAEGVGSQRIRIEDPADGEVIGYFDQRWSGRAGTLHLVEAGILEWRQDGWWWRPTFVFTDRFANPLVRLAPDGSVLELVLGDRLGSLTNSWQSALFLLSLGWFLLVVSGRARPPRLTLAV
jgi:hypothetical protein